MLNQRMSRPQYIEYFNSREFTVFNELLIALVYVFTNTQAHSTSLFAIQQALHRQLIIHLLATPLRYRGLGRDVNA